MLSDEHRITKKGLGEELCCLTMKRQFFEVQTKQLDHLFALIADLE